MVRPIIITPLALWIVLRRSDGLLLQSYWSRSGNEMCKTCHALCRFSCHWSGSARGSYNERRTCKWFIRLPIAFFFFCWWNESNHKQVEGECFVRPVLSSSGSRSALSSRLAFQRKRGWVNGEYILPVSKVIVRFQSNNLPPFFFKPVSAF